MSKKSEKTQNIVNESHLPNCYSKGEWQHIIANAIVEAEEIKENKQKKIEERQSEKRRGFRGFLKLIFCPKKVVEGDITTTQFIKQTMILLLKIVAFILLVFGIILIMIVPLSHCLNFIDPMPWIYLTIGIPSGLISLLFAIVFNVSSIEINSIDDKNYLMGVFASFIAIISTIISIVAIFK